MGTASPTKVDITAVQQHTIASSRRRTRIHVIVCHDLNAKSHSLYEMFQFADRVSPEALETLTCELASDIIQDVDMLIGQLQEIKDYARRQLARWPARGASSS